MASNISTTQSIAVSERSLSVSVSEQRESRTAGGIQSEQRTVQNSLILEASLKVSIRSGNESQALLFRTAIDKINELLAPARGPDALQNALGEDNSPEGTAGRILAFATGFFESYATQHPGKDPASVVKDFVDLIRGGFEQGFNEAVDILSGLKVFEGDIASGIQKTFELVQKGLDDFLASRLEALTGSDEGDVAAGDGGEAAR